MIRRIETEGCALTAPEGEGGLGLGGGVARTRRILRPRGAWQRQRGVAGRCSQCSLRLRISECLYVNLERHRVLSCNNGHQAESDIARLTRAGESLGSVRLSNAFYLEQWTSRIRIRPVQDTAARQGVEERLFLQVDRVRELGSLAAWWP